MTKEELLAELSAKVSSGEVSLNEVLSRLNMPAQAAASEPRNAPLALKHFSATKLLYVIGTIIVVVGIVVLVSQVWEGVGVPGRIFVTLGLGFLLTMLGSLLTKSRPETSIGSVFHAMGGMLIPGGAMVTLSELGVNLDSPWPVAGVFGLLFAFYALLCYVHKSAILTFFAIANGTAFVYLLVAALLDNSVYGNWDVYAYLTMAVGASYILLGYAFTSGWNAKLVSILYAFGSIAFMSAAFSRVFDSVPWQMLYFFIVAGGMFLAVYMRNRVVLAVSTLFLIGHISYITGEYFADSVGWPICLVVLGFIFIGLGYASVNLSKKYITSQQVQA